MEVLVALASIMGIYVVVLWALLSVYVTILLIRLSQPEKLIEVIENGPAVLAEGLPFLDQNRWAADRAFVPDAIFDFRAGLRGQITTVAVWRQRAGPDFMYYYIAPKLRYTEFVTHLDGDADLTTASTKFAVMLPLAPGNYVQAFDRLDLDTLFERHTQAREHLGKMGHQPLADCLPVEVRVADSVRRQIAWIRSLPFWQARGGWWFLVRRNVLNNKTIAERYPRG